MLPIDFIQVCMNMFYASHGPNKSAVQNTSLRQIDLSWENWAKMQQ